MNKLTSILVAAAAMSMATFAFANDEMKHGDMHSHMSAMDTNGDGMISKDEFMTYHQAMWDKLPKNKDGMVAMKDLEMMHHDKMKHDGMMKDDHAKPDKDGGG